MDNLERDLSNMVQTRVRMACDPTFAMLKNLRSTQRRRISISLKKRGQRKQSSTLDIVFRNCTVAEKKSYMESLSLSGGNKRGYDKDHLIALALIEFLMNHFDKDYETVSNILFSAYNLLSTFWDRNGRKSDKPILITHLDFNSGVIHFLASNQKKFTTTPQVKAYCEEYGCSTDDALFQIWNIRRKHYHLMFAKSEEQAFENFAILQELYGDTRIGSYDEYLASRGEDRANILPFRSREESAAYQRLADEAVAEDLLGEDDDGVMEAIADEITSD